MTTQSNFSPTLPTTQHTHTHSPSPSSYPHSLTPTHPPTSLLPPTCQTLLDIQKRKQETCCLPGKCCLHILWLKNYASQQKQKMSEGSEAQNSKKYKKGKLKTLCSNPKRVSPSFFLPSSSSSSFSNPLTPLPPPPELLLLVWPCWQRGRGFCSASSYYASGCIIFSPFLEGWEKCTGVLTCTHTHTAMCRLVIGW